MKQMLTLVLFLFVLCGNSYSQRVCASTFYPPQIQQADNPRYQRFLQLEQHIANYKSSMNSGGGQQRLSNPNSIIIIPVVVHVIHTPGEAVGAGRNISVAQIQSQIEVLNEDFRRLNADRVNTPNAFAGVAANSDIEFRLACVDPNGNPTNGITRTGSNVTSFSHNDDIKFTGRGGRDAWPTDRYLNMWVGNLGSGLLGYAQFPFDYANQPNTDGVVIRTTSFGRVGNVTAPYNTGRTATHEVGHWLDLFHIWGDGGNSSCNDTDHCGDTPNQAGPSSGCPAFPSASCSNNGNMSMNYMDYTDDACMNIFTADQRTRMRAVFAPGGPRAPFLNNYFRIVPPGNPICGATGTVTVNNPNCLPVTWTVVSGPAAVSNGQGTNTVTLQRNGNGGVVLRATAGGYVDEVTFAVGTPLVTWPEVMYPTGGCLPPSFNVTYTSSTQFSAYYEWGYYEGPSSTHSQSPFVLVNPAGTSQQAIRVPNSLTVNRISVRGGNACGLGLQNIREFVFDPNCNGGGDVEWKAKLDNNPMQESITPAGFAIRENVVSSVLSLQVPASEQKQVILISDMNGRTMKKLTATGVQMNVDVSSLSSGLYMVTLVGKTKKETHRFVKR